jgi:sarcosine oxidase
MWDTVVLGLGGVGSFALRDVVRETKGESVLGIEQFTRGHDKGSSHGKSRVYRRAYFERSSYVPWIDFSLNEFTKLQ